jgi:hypothetical protein
MADEVIIGVEHPFIDNCMINYDAEGIGLQCVKLVVMDVASGKLRRVTASLDHRSNIYVVTDQLPLSQESGKS